MELAQNGISKEELTICKAVLQQVCRNFEEGIASSEKLRIPKSKGAVP
jgi:hypothetical protein